MSLIAGKTNSIFCFFNKNDSVKVYFNDIFHLSNYKYNFIYFLNY